MSDVQEQILDAVKILADNAVSASNATITIECKIIEVIDAGVGLYKVEYKANKFECYSSNPSIVYNINDTVYVIVPDGNFDKNKTIIGAVAPVASMYVETEKVDNYIPISENLIRDLGVIELSTYYSKIKNINNPVIDDFRLLFSDYLKTYNTYLFSAKIKTNIELSQQVQGNYGLKLSLPIISNDKQVENYYKDIILDVSNIEGSPYRLTEYTLQNLYIELPEDTTYDDNRNPILIAFVEGFPEQKEAVEPIPEKDINIWIKDITLKAVDVLTIENKESYYLSLVSDKGNYFLAGDGSTTKTLSPVLKIKGKNTNVKNYDCYWFLEDASIDTTSDDYTTIGGLGWRCLNAKTNVSYTEEGKMTFQYVTNVYELKVTNEDVYGSSKYKCVLIRGNIIISGSLVLHNFQSGISTDLVSATGSNDFIKDTGYITLISKVWDKTYNPATMQMKTAWQRFDKNGNFYSFTEGEDGFEILRLNELVEDHYETEIRFRSSLVEDLNLITCSVYRSEILDDKIKEFILGTNSLVVTTSDNFVYKVAIQNGDVLYKYDADGDSPMVADYDGPMSSRISAINPISYRIFKADGLELTENEYLYCETKWAVPINSMITIDTKRYRNEDEEDPVITEDDEYRYVFAKHLYYTIVPSYNVKKDNNTIILIIKLPDAELNESINIKFLKDGESGTNGSKYAGIITFNKKSYGEDDCKLQFICLGNETGNDEWYSYYGDGFTKLNTDSHSGIPIGKHTGDTYPYFDIDIYSDGVPFDKSNVEIDWSIFDESATDPFLEYDKTTDYFRLKSINKWNNTYVTTIQAKITINQPSESVAAKAGEEVLYAYYPIEVSYIEKGRSLTDDQLFAYDLKGGFEKVLYASDGTNPKYNNVNPFVLNLKPTELTYKRTYDWSGSQNITVKPIEHQLDDGSVILDECNARPIPKYDSGISKNYIKVTMSAVNDSEEYHNIEAEKEQKENELIQKQNELEKYQQESEDITKILNNYCAFLLASCENCKSNMKTAKDIINNRNNGIGFMNQLVNAVDALSDYCFKTSGVEAKYFNTFYLPSIKHDFISHQEGEIIYTGQIDHFINLGRDEFNNLWHLKHYYKVEDKIKTVENVINNLIIGNKSSFKKKYAAVYAKIQSLATDLVDRNSKYKVCYDNLISYAPSGDATIDSRILGQPQEQAYFDCINILRLTYSDNNEDLNKLINADSNNFNQVKSRLSILTDSIFTNQASYNYIETSIVNAIEDIAKSYQSNYYVKYYTEIINNINLEIDNINIKINELEKMLNSFKMEIIHIKPILLLYNRYEMTNLNDWDGNKLYTGSDPKNSTFLLAPQIGAGKKEENGFTGMVMGLKNLNKVGTQTQIGLFGYNTGIQTLFLNSRDGSAILGKSGNGQIIIDPNSSVNKALIYSSNYFGNSYNTDGKPSDYSKIGKGTNGLLLNLTDAYIHFGSNEGYIYSGGHNKFDDKNNPGFYLSQNGLSIVGYKDNKIRSYMGIKTDGDPEIYSGGHSSFNDMTNPGFYLSQNGLSIVGEYKEDPTNPNSETLKSYIGIDTSKNPTIYSGGHSTLSNYKKNGFYLGSDGLSIGSSIRISSAENGTIMIGRLADQSGVTHRYWTISGGGQKDSREDTTYSYIGYNADRSYVTTDEHNNVSIQSGAQAESVYIGTNAIRLGQKFAVDEKGNMFASNVNMTGKITATSGTIAGWRITNTGLTDGSNAWLRKDLIACGQHGATHVRMAGKSTSGDNSGYLEVGVNEAKDSIRIFYNKIEKYDSEGKVVASWP